MTSLRLLHQIHLAHDAWGGMEKQFANLLQSTANDPRVAHHLSEDLRDLEPGIAQALTFLHEPAEDARSWHGLTVPNWRGMRQLRQTSQARAWNIDAVLSWNRFGDTRPLQLASRIGAATVYWERGAAWFPRSRAPDADFLDGFDRYLANSRACAAMLNYWGVTAPIEICRPGILSTQPGRLRRLTPGQPLRLGFCARLQTHKGGVLAVHALAQLRRAGVDAHLIVAGDGPDQLAMQTVAQRLGFEADDPALRFLGRLAAVDDFLDGIDLLLHPALREPYGNACAEALVAGVPVVAAAVDGLPEVVDSGVDGLCLVPTLDLADYADFGGDPAGVHPRVYRPEIQRIGEPGFCDPAHLTRAVLELVSDPVRYAAASHAALNYAPQRFAYAPHVERLFAQLAAAVADRRPRPGTVAAAEASQDPMQANGEDRADKAAALIGLALAGRSAARVADVACGEGRLQASLRRRRIACSYQGYDLLPQSSEVQALDISRQRLPQSCDLVAMLGLSEYLEDLPAVLQRLNEQADWLVISHTLGDRPRSVDELQRLGWRNHLSGDEFERYLLKAAWSVRECLNTDDGKTRLWLCTSV